MTSNDNKTVLIMAGGTGGHVFPALAVAHALEARGCAIEWFGTQNGIEARVVPENNIALHCLTISGLRGKGIKALVSAPWRIVRAISQSVKLLRKIKPNVVLGMGGYVAGPGGVAAKVLGIPLVIHEQNARAGTTNKLLAKFADRVLCAFPEVLPRCECIGNPVREDILAVEEPETRLEGRNGSIRLLVLGGSLGAQAINRLVPETIMNPSLKDQFTVVHQSGPKNIDDTKQCYQQCNVNAEIVPFIENMAERLAWADLVICRAGALTVAELSCVGVASILVPFPYAIDDHQTANAQWLASNGAGLVRQQSDLTPKGLTELLTAFCEDREKLFAMAIAARRIGKPEATKRCADICLEVACG